MEEIKSAQMKYIAILQDLIAKQEMKINELKEKLSEASRPASSEVKHGKWIYCGHHDFHGHVFECSVCGRYLFANSKEDVCDEYPYCHCGAKMDEEEQK